MCIQKIKERLITFESYSYNKKYPPVNVFITHHPFLHWFCHPFFIIATGVFVIFAWNYLSNVFCFSSIFIILRVVTYFSLHILDRLFHLLIIAIVNPVYKILFNCIIVKLSSIIIYIYIYIYIHIYAILWYSILGCKI